MHYFLFDLLIKDTCTLWPWITFISKKNYMLYHEQRMGHSIKINILDMIKIRIYVKKTT